MMESSTIQRMEVQSTGALYKALVSTEPNPRDVHNAIEEIRQLAGQNVIDVLGAKIDALGSRIDATNSRIDAMNSRIDTLQRVIWPLIGLLATTVFGMLYQVVISN